MLQIVSMEKDYFDNFGKRFWILLIFNKIQNFTDFSQNYILTEHLLGKSTDTSMPQGTLLRQDFMKTRL